MFIDYVPLMLINMAAGLFLLAWYVFKGIDSIEQKKWAGGFAMAGAVALISGLHMSLTWPLPSSYNVAFGQMSVLLGILFLGASLSLAKGWDLFSVAIYAFFAGLAAIVVGARIINLGLTKTPFVCGIGFIFSGLSGVLVAIIPFKRRNRPLRIFVAVLLVAAAFIWLEIGCMAYWMHLSRLLEWKPLLMR